jgi:drug/metabolite transporter (DMT)-like permease
MKRAKILGALACFIGVVLLVAGAGGGAGTIGAVLLLGGGAAFVCARLVA